MGPLQLCWYGLALRLKIMEELFISEIWVSLLILLGAKFLRVLWLWEGCCVDMRESPRDDVSFNAHRGWPGPPHATKPQRPPPHAHGHACTLATRAHTWFCAARLNVYPFRFEFEIQFHIVLRLAPFFILLLLFSKSCTVAVLHTYRFNIALFLSCWKLPCGHAENLCWLRTDICNAVMLQYFFSKSYSIILTWCFVSLSTFWSLDIFNTYSDPLRDTSYWRSIFIFPALSNCNVAVEIFSSRYILGSRDTAFLRREGKKNKNKSISCKSILSFLIALLFLFLYFLFISE